MRLETGAICDCQLDSRSQIKPRKVWKFIPKLKADIETNHDIITD